MATAYFPRHGGHVDNELPLGSTMRQWLQAKIETFFDRLRMRRERQRTINELSQLSDRLLDDIGVKRADIWALADQLTRDKVA